MQQQKENWGRGKHTKQVCLSKHSLTARNLETSENYVAVLASAWGIIWA